MDLMSIMEFQRITLERYNFIFDKTSNSFKHLTAYVTYLDILSDSETYKVLWFPISDHIRLQSVEKLFLRHGDGWQL